MSLAIAYDPTVGWNAEIFSRASETTARWYRDLIFIHVLIREIGKHLGFTTDKVTVFWRIACAYQSITSMPLFLILNGEEKWLQGHKMEEFPYHSWKYYTVKRYNRSYVGDDYLNYGVQKRAGKAYKMMKGLMPARTPLYTEDLELLEYEVQETKDGETFDEGNILLPDDLYLDEDLEKLAKEAEEEGDFGSGGYR
jgi:hypothetical protein